jgi:hypothetical protein
MVHVGREKLPFFCFLALRLVFRVDYSFLNIENPSTYT